MAAEVQTGVATVWGVANDGTAISIGGYATFLLEGSELTHKFRLKTITDANDFDANHIATNQHVEQVLTFKPSGSTRAAASAVAVFIAALASVVTSHFKIAAFNGTWTYMGDETISLKSNDSAGMKLPVWKYDDSAQNTSLSTTISG